MRWTARWPLGLPELRAPIEILAMVCGADELRVAKVERARAGVTDVGDGL